MVESLEEMRKESRERIEKGSRERIRIERKEKDTKGRRDDNLKRRKSNISFASAFCLCLLFSFHKEMRYSSEDMSSRLDYAAAVKYWSLAELLGKGRAGGTAAARAAMAAPRISAIIWQ